MKYICFTNNPLIVSSLDPIDEVDTIFVDLEILGKNERQRNTNSLISNHSYQDINILRTRIKSSFLGVRIDPFNFNTENQINKCIQNGAEVIMLPMFSTLDEIKEVLSIINQRAYLDLLFETPESLNLIDIFPKESIRKIHFGINDLSLAFSLHPMFKCLFSKELEIATNKAFQRGVDFGIGGIGAKGSKPYSPKLILSKIIKMKSSRVILSRSFLNEINLQNSFLAKKSAHMKIRELINLQNELANSDESKIQINIDIFKHQIKI